MLSKATPRWLLQPPEVKGGEGKETIHVANLKEGAQILSGLGWWQVLPKLGLFPINYKALGRDWATSSFRGGAPTTVKMPYSTFWWFFREGRVWREREMGLSWRFQPYSDKFYELGSCTFNPNSVLTFIIISANRWVVISVWDWSEECLRVKNVILHRGKLNRVVQSCAICSFTLGNIF